MTNHEVTYCFRINEEEDKTGVKVVRVYISDPISREEQFMAVFFVLMLRYPQITPKGFEESIENVLLKVKEDFESDIQENNGRPNKRKRLDENQKPSELSHYTKYETDIYDHYKDDAEVFYSNENYVLAKYLSEGKEFAIKCCDLFNSSSEARDEISNEMTILEFINNKFGKKLAKICITFK